MQLRPYAYLCIKRPGSLLGIALLVCQLTPGSTAQGRTPNKNVLPRVGTIKDYPATGLMTGCGNLYFYSAQPNSSNTDYVFLARGDGTNAWMNLNGRDVRLRRLKSSKQRRLVYRLGELRIDVIIEDFKPQDAPMNESDPMLKMKIILRKGAVLRTVRAVGDSDC